MASRPELDPQLLHVFATVVRAGSVTRAAAQLGLSKSVVSRQLTRLEGMVGVRLLRRSTRSLRPTELGELVLQEAERVEAAVERIRELAEGYEGEVRGQVRVSCSAALGQLLVLPVCIELAQRHPTLEIALHFEERFVDLVAEGFDVALRFSNLADSSLVSVKLAETPRVIVAAPSYLARHGTPRGVEDLRQHACILYCVGDKIYDRWEFVGPDGPVKVRVSGQLRLNGGLAMVRAAVAGAGILHVDQLALQGELERGELVPILPGYVPAKGFPLYALYVGRGLVPRKTKVFLDALRARLRAAHTTTSYRTTS